MEASPQRVPTRVPAIAVAGLVAAAAVLRFAWLGRNSLWYDETFTALVSSLAWPKLLEFIRLTDTHPPLYYALIKVWTAAAGTSEAALRFPSACFGAAVVGATYALARRVTTVPVSVFAALFVALAPIDVMSSQDARMYALLELLAVGSTWALVAATETRRARVWAAYALLLALMGYTQYLGGLVGIAQGLWVLLYRRSEAPRWGAAAAAALVLYAPWLPSMWWQVTHPPFIGWYAQPLYLSVTDLLGLLAFGGSLLGTASFFQASTLPFVERLILVLPFCVVLWRGTVALRAAPSALGLVVLPPLVVVGTMLAVSAPRPLPVFLPRWFSFLLPFYAVLLAQGVFDLAAHVRARRTAVVPIVTAALVLSSLPVFWGYYLDPGARPDRWRDAAGLLRQHLDRDNILIYASPEVAIALRYYLPDPPSTAAYLPITVTPGWLDAVTSRYQRVWLVRTAVEDPRVTARLGLFAARFTVLSERDFGGVRVYSLKPARR